MGIPWRLRVLWWLMVKAERLAQWCRCRWLRWHEGKGAIVSDDEPPTPPGGAE